jgi:replicative DNA helicase
MALNKETLESALSETITLVPNATIKSDKGPEAKMSFTKSENPKGSSNNHRFHFDRSFQEKIVQAMIMDRTWATQIVEVLKVEFFEYSYLKKIASSYIEYYEKYKEFPSIDLLATIVASELKNAADEAIRNQVKDFLVRVSEHQNLGDLGYVKEKSLDFCKRVGLQKALEESIEFIETEKYEKVVETIKKAISAGTEHSAGLDLTTDVDARYSETFRRTVATGIPELDQRKILNGGLGAGEIGVVVAATGCHAKGTKILTYDGTLKNVEDIRVGDLLMGPDSKPRKVLGLVRGRETMYEITPTRGGEPFVVNASHVMSLMRTNDGTKRANKTCEITVKDYLKQSKTFKHAHKLWRPLGIDFGRPSPAGLSPYVLGLLLRESQQYSNRIELNAADIKNASSVIDEMQRLGINSEIKFIPYSYKCAPRNDRLELLAGLLDTDRHCHNNCYEYVSKFPQLAEDVAFIARSVGLQVSSEKNLVNGETYHRLHISDETSCMPSRLLGKLARSQVRSLPQRKNALLTEFSVRELPEDDFYGFTIDKDHLYLTGDFVAHHNCGKSHILTHFGAQALLSGKNVLHYTFELNERAIGIRYDSHLLDINSLDCYEHRESIKEFYRLNADTLGHLKIKYYPTGVATVNTLRAHIDKLANEGFVPDLLIVDYAGIMRSTEKYELLRLELKKVYEELRGFANELDIPVWTASQSNKEGADKDYVDLTNMAEAYGQAHVADFVIGLSRKSLNKSTGLGNIFIAKNRAGVDGIQFQIILDTARSKLKIISDAEALAMQQDAELFEDGNLKNFLRQKVREYQKRQ